MPISAAVCSKASPNVRNMLQYLPTIHEICLDWFMFTSMQSLCLETAPIRTNTHSKTLLFRNCWELGVWSSDGYRTIPSSKRPTNIAALLIFHLAVDLVLPFSLIVYATTTIFCVIGRTHRQIAAQINSIGGNNDFVGSIPSLIPSRFILVKTC